MINNKITDFRQGIFNCPLDFIQTGSCAYCKNVDRRSSNIRQFPYKPRCAEPNFNYFMCLRGVDDKGFNHENILPVLYWSLNSYPPYFCVCGKFQHRIIFCQIDKFHFPIAKLICECGREKTIIIHRRILDLTNPWRGQQTKRKFLQIDKKSLNKATKCRCGNQYLIFQYDEYGFEFYPAEGPTIVLFCKKCQRIKKIRVNSIDITEPWLNQNDSVKKEEIIIFSNVNQCEDMTTEQKENVVIIERPLL